ncbi:MAG: hypothetical protein ACKOWF_10355 [Chloroflexota bacterium]
MVFRVEQGSAGPGLVDSILRYKGSADKDAIRDADRRLRDAAAAAYSADLARVRRVAGDLANQRRIKEIAPIDEFADELSHFIDRVRTATYGYDGLMGELSAKPGVAGQLRQFDEGLMAGRDGVAAAVTALEAAAAGDGDVAASARAGRDAVGALLQQFDLRGKLAETGVAIDRESVLKALNPGLPQLPHPAWNLTEGVALSVLGDDFIVDARIGVESDDEAFRLFRIVTDPEEWLLVPRAGNGVIARVRPYPAPAQGDGTTLDGITFAAASEGSGVGEVVGAGGGSGVRPVRYLILAGESDPEARGVLLDWGSDRQAFAGRAVHPADIEIFGVPKGI